MNLWVLWNREHDSSAAHIERVYFDHDRGMEDLQLLKNVCTGSDWKLDQVPFFGAPPICSYETAMALRLQQRRLIGGIEVN